QTRARTKRADANLSPGSFMSQRVQHILQDGADKRRIQIEYGTVRQVRSAGITLNKPYLVQVERLSALPGTIDIGRLKFDPSAVCAGANGSDQCDLAQSGTEIDQEVPFSKC